MAIYGTSTERRVKYVLGEKHFYEQRAGAVVIYECIGPASPAASFAIYGDLSLDEKNRLTVDASGTELLFPPTCRPNSVSWIVKISLLDSGKVLDTQQVKRHHRHYVLAPSRNFYIGEAYFDLPAITQSNNFTLPVFLNLHIEGHYLADFGPHGQVPPMAYGLFRVGNAAKVTKDITIWVTYAE